MAYLMTIANYPPYLAAGQKTGYISKKYGGGHTGIDSVGNLWDMPVCAMFDGTVISTETTAATGNSITYQSDNGKVKVVYLHLRDKVKLSGKVTKGQVVGHEGSTGYIAKGKHLHTTIYINGAMVDPLPYLNGTKALPLENNTQEGITMVRKVIRDDLNLRTGAGTNYASYGFVPKGTLLNIVKTQKVGTATWGRHTCILKDGKTYTGWSNIGDTWSQEYTGTLSNGGEIAGLQSQLAAANAKLDAVRKAVG